VFSPTPAKASRAAYRLKSLQITLLDAAALREDGAAPGTDAGPETDAGPGVGVRSSLLPPGVYFVAAPLREGFVSSELKTGP